MITKQKAPDHIDPADDAPVDPPTAAEFATSSTLDGGPVALELATVQAENAMLRARLAVYEPAQPDHWCNTKRAMKISGMKREKLRRYCKSGEVKARKERGQWIVNATHATRVRLEEARLGNDG
jgi:hypothetical protein